MVRRKNLSRLDKRLLIAASKGYHQEVKALVTAGANVNVVDNGQACLHGYTPLMLAARCGDLKCIEILIRLGADIHAGGFSNSAVIQAINFNHLDCVKAIVRHGAMLNRKGLYGRTELMTYLRQHHTEDEFLF